MYIPARVGHRYDWQYGQWAPQRCPYCNPRPTCPCCGRYLDDVWHGYNTPLCGLQGQNGEVMDGGLVENSSVDGPPQQ